MKVKISGDTPLERLTNFTRRVINVSKEEINHEETKWKRKKAQRKKQR
jgi:hypothetical protein